MEPNQSADLTPGNAASTSAPNQPHGTPPPTSSNPASAEPASAGTSSAEPKPADGKNWTEYANLQKVVDQLPQGVRDFCSSSWGQINKLSTTQMAVGAAALAGLGYLAIRAGKTSGKSSGGAEKDSSNRASS